MEFKKEDIEFITKNIVMPFMEEYTKGMIKVQEQTMSMQMKTNKMIVNLLTNKCRSIELENKKNMSFIKAVLFTNHLSNEECYKTYITEWDRLNKTLIDSYLNDDDNEITKVTDKPKCRHVKVYADHILTSNPPKYPWKCRECKETGVDDEEERFKEIRADIRSMD